MTTLHARRRIAVIGVVLGLGMLVLIATTGSAFAATEDAATGTGDETIQQLDRIDQVDQTAIDEHIDEILSRTAFREAESETWWDRTKRRVGDAIGRWLGQLVGAALQPGVWTFLAATVLVALAVIAGLTIGRRRAATAERQHRIDVLLGEEGLDPDDLLARARAAAAAGDHAGVVRLRFLLGLVLLARDGRLDLTPGLTTHGAALILDDRVFDDLAEQFDVVFYGNRPADANDARQAEQGWDRVLGATTWRIG